eukprot:13872325-Alexandrium_andersonii.AAC.1
MAEPREERGGVRSEGVRALEGGCSPSAARAPAQNSSQAAPVARTGVPTLAQANAEARQSPGDFANGGAERPRS